MNFLNIEKNKIFKISFSIFHVFFTFYATCISNLKNFISRFKLSVIEVPQLLLCVDKMVILSYQALMLKTQFNLSVQID